MLIASTGFWVLTTLITQCTDPPNFLQQWRKDPTKSSHVIPDVIVEHWRPQPHSETQRSRSSESQRSRLSQQNVPAVQSRISTSNVQPSLVTRSVVDWDRSNAMNHSLFDQTSVGTSEMSNVNFYPAAGETTVKFSQLSISGPAVAQPYYAQLSVEPRPTTERIPFTTVEPFEPAPSVFTDSSQFSDPPPAPSVSTRRSRDVQNYDQSSVDSDPPPAPSISTRRSRDVQNHDHLSVDTGLSSLEELIARAVRKSTRRRSTQSSADKVKNGVEKGTRSTSPLTLGSLDTHDDAGDESILNPITTKKKHGDAPSTRIEVKERDEYVQKDEIRRPTPNGGGGRTTSLSNRSWNPTGMKYMRIRDDSDFQLNSPPLEISVNMEESDDFILEHIGAEARQERFNVITPDAKDIYTVCNAGRSASFGGERCHEDRHTRIPSVQSDAGQWLAEMAAVNRQYAASSPSIVSASSFRLGDTAKEKNNESFDPYVASRPRQRALSTPNIYESSSVFARRVPDVPGQAHGNRKETDRPPLMRTNLVPRKEGTSALPPRERGNEISALMSEEFSGHRVVSWGGSSRTHVRSRSVPRGAIENVSHPLKGDARSLGEVDNASVGNRTNSIFRQDRDKRAGIHAPAVITVDSDDGDDGSVVSSKSQLARKAREARLKRLAANQHYSQKIHEDKLVAVTSNTQIAEKARQARAQRLKATLSSQSSVRSRIKKSVRVTVSACQQSSGYGYTKTMAADISNSMEDSTLDTLDAHLAEVQRPVGAEYGSDEDSV